MCYSPKNSKYISISTSYSPSYDTHKFTQSVDTYVRKTQRQQEQKHIFFFLSSSSSSSSLHFSLTQIYFFSLSQHNSSFRSRPKRPNLNFTRIVWKCIFLLTLLLLKPTNFQLAYIAFSLLLSTKNTHIQHRKRKNSTAWRKRMNETHEHVKYKKNCWTSLLSIGCDGTPKRTILSSISLQSHKNSYFYFFLNIRNKCTRIDEKSKNPHPFFSRINKLFFDSSNI